MPTVRTPSRPQYRSRPCSPQARRCPAARAARVGQADRRGSVEQTVARGLGRPEEVAGATALLLSEDTPLVTGAPPVVDGGRSACRTSC
ncbi:MULTISPECIES: SDR family oxidoreductase [Streptomyces]|uniref:SDR family oxidoreductase n=1 Tax=Streptomyces glycanivorans TaxID=3033808 RepID=A0ABY9JQX6_9ACTN|nr:MULTISPECIES: SDR family oxidoreductase [unclassified Streptomyces]WSQ82499.1 SDR family oxidoreductase [Streptomyces sp. NBC_01213]TXS12638.1 SDR family oxidoreductase [Streptomyces sp. wa22]WLQ69116.1 SDR family oxidoreductase [Streptomyces sp. Alt3]WSQ89819.1 SDR family oxidoreductase [Streptomyces sp. NBC_01212]WSR11202.1 SDR family oxidoreductase [Streptomyces sp. NBC_01208]